MTFPRTVLQAPPAAPEILARCRELVAPALAGAIDGLHPWVAEMAGYALGRCEVGGAPATHRQGKGVRQALALLGAEAAGGSAEAGVPGAVAVELLHTFSLLHDDIMDGDALRRGRPALWKAYGTGPAVLAGDALFALAVETLTAAPASPHAAAAVGRLTRASRDLVRGQADDLLFAHRPWTGPDAVSAGSTRRWRSTRPVPCSAARWPSGPNWRTRRGDHRRPGPRRTASRGGLPDRRRPAGHLGRSGCHRETGAG